MNIDPLQTPSNQAFTLKSLGQGPNAGAEAGAPTQSEPDNLSSPMTDKVRAALAAIPEIRPEVVERARQLFADPKYPSPEIVNNIAGLITPFSAEE